MYKILEDVKCSTEVAFCWALNAKNSLQNIHGFSPYQLTFGRNPNLPSVFENNLPALEGVTSSNLIASHLNSSHKAREEYLKLEASEKIQRALRSKTCAYSNITYFNGDKVFYKREGEKRRRGPGRVIGQDGSKILIKIPTGLISAHSCSVILVKDAENSENKHEEPSNINNNIINNSDITHNFPDEDNLSEQEYRNNESNDDDQMNQNDVQHNENTNEFDNQQNIEVNENQNDILNNGGYDQVDDSLNNINQNNDERTIKQITTVAK